MAGAPVVFTVRYTREHCLATAWRYWQRRLGYRYTLELAIGAGLLALATQGPYRRIEVALMIAVGVFAVLGAGLFLVHWYRALAWLAAATRSAPRERCSWARCWTSWSGGISPPAW